MKKLNDLHQKAMDFSDMAFIAEREGNSQSMLEFSRQAFELETKAAEMLRNDLDAEPTRSILFRSAASMAMDCNEFRKAEQLIATALAGNTPPEIADELRDLLEQVNFKRHLKVQNVDLSESQLQLSISGPEVGHGVTLSDIFVERVKDMERMIFRTVERLLGRAYREGGAALNRIQQGYSLYMTVPRPGSFTVSLQVGRQMELPGIDLSVQVIDEILECFELINEGKDDLLKEKIPEESYYVNFVALAKRIAPDGEKVSMVGLTKVRNHHEVGVAFTKKRPEFSPKPQMVDTQIALTQVEVEVRGRLLFADARKSNRKIQLVEENGTSHNIAVPQGMMDDIVKPLWDEIVVVKGFRANRNIQLSEIYKVE